MSEARLEHEGEVLPIAFRDVAEGDVPFIFSSWLQSYRDSEEVRNIGNDAYFGGHHKVIAELAQRPEAKCFVACASDFPAQIFGWAYGESGAETVLHYVYVKQQYRRMGIARGLLQKIHQQRDGGILCTHRTHIFDLMKKKYSLRLDPYRTRS